MGIVSSLFAKPVSKALAKSVTKQADVVVPKIAAEVAEPITAGVSLPTKSLVNKKDDASPTFAKGGVVKNKMNKPFAEGGVMQEGGTVDPVSGNDVPIGSMAEEVRDDIPAQLSEGEFVFPADVVRYIGLEKLMAMRDKAKAGLKRMEEIGQMGNAEEVDNAEALFGDDMDDDTFSSEIDSIMNDGGEQEYAAGGDVRKYAPGGYVGGAENEQLYRDTPIKGFEMVQMTNDAGQTLFIPFINGVAQLNVPDGYRVKKAGTVDTPAVAAPVESAPVQDSGGGADSDGGGGGSVGVDDAGLATSTNVSPGTVSVIGNVLGALGIPGIATVANLGKNTIANTLSGLSSSNAAASNQAMMAAQMGLTPAEAASTMGIAATASAVDSLSSSPVGTTAATPGTSGTGASAAAAGAAAAAAAAAAGLSSEAQGAAAQAAANAALGGSSASEASEAGATAATATGNASDPDGSVGGGGPSAGDSAPSDGPAGAAVSGDPGYVKGGLVKKRISEKTGKRTSFVTRQK